MGLYWPGRGVPVVAVSVLLYLNLLTLALMHMERYFGIEDKRRQSIETIIGYMPTVAHWGWNGNARRYWDFL